MYHRVCLLFDGHDCYQIIIPDYSIHKIEGEQPHSTYTTTARLMEAHMKGYWEATEECHPP